MSQRMLKRVLGVIEGVEQHCIKSKSTSETFYMHDKYLLDEE